MTFYEAALRVLEGEGRPLSFLEITEKSIAQNLLSHVGKTPEQTMLSRLAAMARRARDRKVIVTAKDTFALVEWALPENPEALALTGTPEPNPEEALPPLRPVERHPEPRSDNVRAAGRSPMKRHRDDEERPRRKRYPPIPDVCFEVLSEHGSLKPSDIIGKAVERELASEELSAEKILTALLEDNQRRIDVGRRPQFGLSVSGEVTLEKADAPSDVPPLEVQAAFAAALGIPLEEGRPVLPRPQPGELDEAGVQMAAAKAAVKDARRSFARTLRRRLAELESGTLEKSIIRMLQGHGFRELKVAKRSKEGPLLTARKREGSVELRYAIRIVRAAPGVDRKAVQELRRDLGHYAAQVGLIATPADARGDARAEAVTSGALVLLWCGDALGEKFLESKTGVSVTQVELFEIDDRFFEIARVDSEEAQRRREERSRERDRRHGSEEPSDDREPREERSERSPSRESENEVAATSPSEPAVKTIEVDGSQEPQGSDDDDDDDEGDDDLEVSAERAPGAPASSQGQPGVAGEAGGDRKRRRRRRRGRRGRGNRPDAPPGAAPQPGAAPVEAGAPSAPDASSAPAPVSEPVAAPSPSPSGSPSDGGAAS